MTDQTQRIQTLEAAQPCFLAQIKQERTREVYGYGLKALGRFLAETRYGGWAGAEFPLAVLRDDLLVAFFNWLTEQYDTPHTIQLYLAALKRFLIWLDAEDLLPLEFQLGKAQSRLKAARGERGPAGYRHQRPDPELPRIVTYYDELELPETVGRVDQKRLKLTILRNRAIAHTLYASAGRVSEVAALTREQVMEGRLDEIEIVGKGERTRIILLTTEARQAIRAYLKARGSDGYPSLFISHGPRGTGSTLNRTSIWRVIKEAARVLDLHERTSPHDFRHFRATQLLNDGLPLELVQAYLGHADIATTRKIYAHTKTSILKQQLAAHHRSPTEALADLEEQRAEADQSLRADKR
jgi:site-specific recombinase XerD